tara:strand:- start:379 stop:813 length:435 start_codon:yes stop_codon:yes gene_type:complete
MKHLFLLLFLGLNLSNVAFAQGNAEMSFAEEKFNFGELDEGPKVNHEFMFTNTGKEALVLSNVKASCGCTTPSWPKDPILPGEEGKILVTYNTARRIGSFNKSITITSNATETSKVLYISGKVNAVPEEETMPIKQPLMMAPSN